MDQGTKFMAIATVIIIAVILQVALISLQDNQSPAQTAVCFTKAYFKLDESMGQYLCNELIENAETDLVDDYLHQVKEEAKTMGFKKNYMKTALANAKTQTEMLDENTAIVRIQGKRTRYLNPVFGAVATIFFLTESYEVDKTLKVVNEDGQWKVCGKPFMLAER